MTITAEASKSKTGGALSPIDRLHGLVADDMAATDKLIHERLGSAVNLIPDLARHLVDSGGKRLRPLLTLAAARGCGYHGREACEARRGGRVRTHRHAAARRCGRCEHAPARQARGQYRVGKQAFDSGGRFSLQPRFRADGGDGRHRRARHHRARVIGDRRGRSDAAQIGEQSGDDRGALPRSRFGQDGGAVRGCGGSGCGGDGRKRVACFGVSRLRSQSRHRVPA